MDVDIMATRFDVGRSSKLGPAVPTPTGLRVKLTGAKLEARPLMPGLPLHPWEGIFKVPVEDIVYFRDAKSDTWMCMMDAQNMLNFRDDPSHFTDEWVNDPICRALHGGNCAVIYDPVQSRASISDLSFSGLLVKIENQSPGEKGNDVLHVRRLRSLILAAVSDTHSTVLDGFRELAVKVVNEDVTEKLLAIPGREGGDYRAGIDAVKQRMKDVMGAYWDATPRFAQAVHDAHGPDLKDYIWSGIAKHSSHDVFAMELPEDQVWIVD
jgi:hypothetical protein